MSGQVFTQFRSHPVGDFLARTIRSIEFAIADWGGRWQLKRGQEPTIIRTPRMALEQWKYALQDVVPPQKEQILVIATRNQRWVQWAVYTACYILQMGYRPIILFSTKEMAQLYGNEPNAFTFWQGVHTIPYVEFIDLDAYGVMEEVNGRYETFIQRAAHTIAAYNLRVEEFEPGDDIRSYHRAVAAAEQMLRQVACAFDQVLQAHPVKRLICPSGLIEKTYAFREVAQQHGVTGAYVEGWAMRPGHMVWNINKPALHHDIDGWMTVLGDWNKQQAEAAKKYMAFREGDAVADADWFGNFHQVQRTTKKEPLPLALEQFLQRSGAKVLLGSNVIGDSATLERATLFKSQQDWIRQVVAFFRQNPQLNLIMRAHPDEVHQRAKLRLGRIAQEAAAGAENIFIIHGHEDVNTYSILEHIDLGLAWVSNIGLDMAVRGKPVILAAAAQYAHLGACYTPSTIEAYFQLILHQAAQPVAPAEAAVQRGHIYHHIIFKAMSLLADSPRYDATDYHLGAVDLESERHTFYRILVGELSDKGRPLTEEVSHV